jgi:hypothetical protein
MNTEIKPFVFQSLPLRVQADEHGNPLFCAKDACDILGYGNSREAVSKHCQSKGVTIRDTHTEGGIQKLTFLSEGNLYRLIIKSNKPEAEPFESWVCDEVLPAIRKTGSYSRNALGRSPTLHIPLIPHEVRQVKEQISNVVRYFPFHAHKSKAYASVYAVLCATFRVAKIEHLSASDLHTALAILNRMHIQSYSYYSEAYGKEEAALKALHLCAGLPVPPAHSGQVDLLQGDA